MRTVDIESWLGRRDPVALDPSAMQFRAQAVDRSTCSGCIFHHQWSKVCHRAGEAAKRAGLPDCGQGFIYVAIKDASGNFNQKERR